jgi:hypothetical protein
LLLLMTCHPILPAAATLLTPGLVPALMVLLLLLMPAAPVLLLLLLDGPQPPPLLPAAVLLLPAAAAAAAAAPEPLSTLNTPLIPPARESDAALRLLGLVKVMTKLSGPSAVIT